MPFSSTAIIGFLSLVGMRIKNAIMLKDEIGAAVATSATLPMRGGRGCAALPRDLAE